MEDKMSYWDQAAAGAKEESGGGVIGKARIDLGYFVFVSGFAGDERGKCIFLPDDETKEARTVARQAAQQFAIANGGESRSARWCAITTLYKDHCTRGSELVSWQNDRLETVPLWTLHQDGPSAAQLLMDQINELGVSGGVDFFGQFTWRTDPYAESLGDAGKTETDDDGQLYYPGLYVPVRLFADVNEARNFITGSSTETSTETTGNAWDDATWEAVLPEMRELKESGTSLKDIADGYEVPLPELLKRLK